MSNQLTERLTMLALGIRGDTPVDPGQPPLVDGVHLRWAPAQELGFPWHGFYLFRREHDGGVRPLCLAAELARIRPQSSSDTRLPTNLGTLSSPKPLLFDTDFETDLAAPVRFDLPAGVTARQVDVRIRMHEREPKTVRTCVDFRRFPLGSGPSPRTEEGAVFTVQHVAAFTPTPDTAIEQWNSGAPGLEFTAPVTVAYRLQIELPCRALRATLLLTNRGPLRVEGFGPDGESAGVQELASHDLARTITVSGKAVTRIVLESSSVDSALLHEICWECPAAAEADPPIVVDFEKWPVARRENPLREQGVLFETFDDEGALLDFVNFETRGGRTGLFTRRSTLIHLPCETNRVELSFSQGQPATIRIEALRANGTTVEPRMDVPADPVVIFEGEGIQRIALEMPADVLLHRVSFRCTASGRTDVEIRALAGETVVTQTVVSGTAGQSVSTSLPGDGITAVVIGPGRATLVEICYIPDRRSLTFGWEPVPEFHYPLCLPVAHADYPCAGKPADPDAARVLALSRVTYGDPAALAPGFPDLHRELEMLVRHGAAGGPMADRVHATLPGHSLSPATQDLPSMPGVRPLDLIYLASLHPAYAQMVGLYFVDRDAKPGVGYDYLLMGDPTGVLGGTANAALTWLASTPNSTEVWAEVVLDRRTEPRATIAPPAAPRAYALPAPAARKIDGTVPDVAGSVGLWWPLPPDPEEEDPDRILFYFPKRASHGTPFPLAEPPASQYQALNVAPILVSEPDPATPPLPPNPRSSDWPPPSVPLHVVDGDLAEGWYSYRLSGQDLFGRRSALGPPASWHQWEPAPVPPPWYYNPNQGAQPLHAFAVALLDKLPPPPPLGVEAWALDPLDRWLFADTVYNAWRATVAPDHIGLRVRWRWTVMQQIQAPDTREFRIYQQPGRWNALLGAIVTVTPASAGQSLVELDFADARPADTYAGARLRAGNDDFAILGSTPGAALRLRVQNIGALDEVAPAEGKQCTIGIPEQHAFWTDTSVAASWPKRLAAVPYEPAARIVVDPVKDVNDQPLTGEAFAGTPLLLNGATATLPAPADVAGIQPWIDHLWIENAAGLAQTHRIVGFDVSLRTLTLESTPMMANITAWIVGRPVREYEVFLPAPDVGAGHPFEPSLTEPIVYAQIAVSAADDRTHVADTWPGQPLGGRIGNESRLSPSATIYRVLQTPPAAPELPDLPGRLFATPADYHDRSYSTFRFNRMANLRVHIQRALDGTLFRRDWEIRETRLALDPANPDHADAFPDDMNAADRLSAAAALNAIAVESDYANLPAAALLVLPLLPGNESAVPAATRDWLIRRTRTSLSSTDTTLFPSSWNAATRAAAAAELNGITTSASYKTLSDNALRALASLPANEAAFTQVTLDPLEMTDARLRDERRPDDDAAFTSASADIRAYTDTLPGRATNRYFYRASFVDGAQNQSALSLAGPPVYLRKVEPPRTPVITKVIGGERKITIRWAENREPDLSHYVVYRASTEAEAEDVRSMTVLTTIAAGVSPEWIDAALIGGRKFFYRLSAVDTSGNESRPSRVAAAVVIDTSIPRPPDWTEQTWLVQRQSDGALLAWPQDGIVPPNHAAVLRLAWRSDTNEPAFLVSRRAPGERVWSAVDGAVSPSSTDPRVFTQVDPDPDPAGAAYRLRVRSSSGVWSNDDAILSVTAAPGAEQ